MATGDVKGGIRKLEQRLRMVNYPRDVDYSGLVKGDPAASLPIISYSLTCYSTQIAEILVSKDIELTAKSDLRFVEAVYKALRDLFNYKPILTKQQFLQCAFSERKLQIICDIIDCVMKKHKELCNLNKVKSLPIKNTFAVKDSFEAFYAEETSMQPSMKSEMLTKKKPLVERHTGSDVHVQSLCCTALPPAVDRKEDVSTSDSETECQSVSLVTQVDSKQLELLKIQLAECQEKLQKLNWMEERLQSLETSMKGKIIIDETDWNNLLSRVVLLETDRLLHLKALKKHEERYKSYISNLYGLRDIHKQSFPSVQPDQKGGAQRDFPPEFTSISEDHTSSKMTSEILSDCKTKADLPESRLQSSGYSSLLSADSSPVAIGINYSSLTEDSKETARERMERITKMMEETSKLLKFSNSSS